MYADNKNYLPENSPHVVQIFLCPRYQSNIPLHWHTPVGEGGASYVINAYLFIIIVVFYTKVLHFRFCTRGSCSRNWFKQVFIIIILSFMLKGVADEKVFYDKNFCGKFYLLVCVFL